MTAFSLEKTTQNAKNFANFENHNFYFNEARNEIKMLTANEINFDDQNNKFGVKKAFFGLDAFFSRQKNESKILIELKYEIFSLITKVR